VVVDAEDGKIVFHCSGPCPTAESIQIMEQVPG
jgi:hypothetical protein